MGALQRELSNLTGADIISRKKSGNQVYYQANANSPIFVEIRSLLVKTVGVADVLRNALSGLADKIAVGFIFGSMAKGTDRAQSDVDLVVIGAVTFKEVTMATAEAQKTIGREINPLVYPVSEYTEKKREGHHFINSLEKEEKIFLMGDEDELCRLGK